ANEETRKRTLIAELERLTLPQPISSISDARLKRELKAKFAEMRELLGRHMTSARQLLRILIREPLRLEAVPTEAGKNYRVLGSGSYMPVFADSGCSVVNGVPNGI
ncbi:MAG: hypothetical protein ACXWWE_04560, partial [Nitrospira sp.]